MPLTLENQMEIDKAIQIYAKAKQYIVVAHRLECFENVQPGWHVVENPLQFQRWHP